MRYLQDVLAQTKAQPLSGTPIYQIQWLKMYSLLKYMRPNKMKELGFTTLLTNGPQPLQVQQTR
jgi:hypothetical protein